MIESVRPIVDEIIVVDTGSDDNTVELVTPIADKVITYQFTNFSDVRTFTLKQATKDWILMLDADERILAPDLPLIVLLTQQTDIDAWLLPRHQCDNIEGNPNGDIVQKIEERVYPDWQARLFMNKPSMKYINPVHESLVGYSNKGAAHPPNAPHIQHYASVFKSHQQMHDRYQMYDRLAKGKDYGKPTY